MEWNVVFGKTQKMRVSMTLIINGTKIEEKKKYNTFIFQYYLKYIIIVCHFHSDAHFCDWWMLCIFCKENTPWNGKTCIKKMGLRISLDTINRIHS